MTTATMSKSIPGDAGWPLVGYSLDLFRNMDHVVKERYERYGEVSWMRMFGNNFVVLLGPDANQFVYQNRGDLFENAAWNVLIGPFFPRGLMLLDFDEHRMHRRIMQQAFQKQALEGYLDIMNPRIAHDIGSWRESAHFEVLPAMKDMTLNVASEVFLGHPPGAEAERLKTAFVYLVRAGASVIRYPLPFTRWRQGITSRRLLEDWFRRELPEKRRSSQDDLFSRLCHAETDQGELFDDEDVINHMIFLLMAAHDTSTITLTNMLYQLARHPDWQTRLREESRALGKQQLSYEDLASLQNMKRVMKETLRLCAPVPSMPRRTTRDCEFKGFEIPANQLVTISPWFAHKMPEYWQEPEYFDPERFAPGREEDKQHPFQWVPFGGGAHKCIGLHFGEMEVMAALHQILLNYEWSVPADYRVRYDFRTLPIPRDKLPINLRRIV